VSFGVSLKRERELRGISLAEIAKTTKISVRLLEAIEKDRYDILPEGVFRKSFIKSYAKYLGMNEDQILNKYVLEVQANTASQSAPVKPTQSFRVTLAGSRRSLLLTLGILLMVLAVSCGFWYLTRASQNKEAPPATQITPRPPSGQPQSEATPPATSIPAPVQTQTTTAASAPSGTAGQAASPPNDPSQLKVLGELAKKPADALVGPGGVGPLELTIEANSPSWISVSAGESHLFSGLMSPAETKKFSLEAPLKVAVGNAGGVRLHVSGQVFSSLGKPGERKTIEVSAANYQQYLAPKTP
jgi:cytoskeleton protein RodZ